MTPERAPESFVGLEREIQACTLCDLSRTRTKAVPGEGKYSAETMFIGEGPGLNEDQQGRPFVGRAGKFLDFLIQSIGLERQDVYITNVVKCRPPENRDPLPYELATCLPFLQRQINLINPRVVVTLGRYSLGTFFPGDVISRVHGTVREKEGRHFFALYHPAAALHQERYREAIVADMQKLGEWLRTSKDRQSDQPLGLQGSVLSLREEEEDQTQLALF